MEFYGLVRDGPWRKGKYFCAAEGKSEQITPHYKGLAGGARTRTFSQENSSAGTGFLLSFFFFCFLADLERLIARLHLNISRTPPAPAPASPSFVYAFVNVVTEIFYESRAA